MQQHVVVLRVAQQRYRSSCGGGEDVCSVYFLEEDAHRRVYGWMDGWMDGWMGGWVDVI